MNKDNNGFMACPFCGRTDEVVVKDKQFFYRLQGEYDTANMKVECERCKVEMMEYTWSEKNYERRVNLVRRKWNERAAKSPWMPLTEPYKEVDDADSN